MTDMMYAPPVGQTAVELPAPRLRRTRRRSDAVKTFKPWRPEEDAVLRLLTEQRVSARVVAVALGRSAPAVAQRRIVLGLRTLPMYAVEWTNGQDCGVFEKRFRSYDEARRWAVEWLTDMRWFDPDRCNDYNFEIITV